MNEPNKNIKKYAQITISLAFFFVPFMGSSLNLALPSIGREFNTSIYLLSWVTTGYILAALSFLIPFGRLADIKGRKKVFFSGITLLSCSALLCGLAWSMESLILFRMLQGTGASMIFATGMAILTSVYPPEERGKALGVNAAFVYAGQSMAPVLGGTFTHYLGWRSIFFIMFCTGLLVMYLAFFKLNKEWIGAQNEKFDLPSAALYTVGVILLMYSLTSIAKWVGAKYLLFIGLLIFSLFLRRQLKISSPLLYVALFTKNITFAFSNLAAFISYSATFAIAFLLSIYLQIGRGYDAQIAGLILLVQPVIMAIFTPLTGKLSDRFEPRIMSSWGMAITSLGLFLLSFLRGDTPIFFLMLTQAIIGLGFSLFIAPNNNAIMGSVPARFYGIASSIIGTMRLSGQTISMALVTLIITLVAGDIEINPAHADLLLISTRYAFSIFGIACLGGIFASLARGNLNNQENIIIPRK